MASLRVSMNSWPVDGKAQAEYENSLISSPISTVALSSWPLLHGGPTPPLFPELDGYGQLGCSFEDNHTPFVDEDEDEDHDLLEDEQQTVTLVSEAPTTSDLNAPIVDDGEESEEDVPLAVARDATRRKSSKVKEKSSKAKRKLKISKASRRRLRVAGKSLKVEPLASGSRICSYGSSYSTSQTDNVQDHQIQHQFDLRARLDESGTFTRIQGPHWSGSSGSEQGGAERRTSPTQRATEDSRCRECPLCQKVRSATAALEEELGNIDPRQAELLRSYVVL